MVILRDWDLLTVLLDELHNQRGYWVEGQRGSIRVCPASTAELSKWRFFVQWTKQCWLFHFFQLLYTNLDSFLFLNWIFLHSNHLVFVGSYLTSVSELSVEAMYDGNRAAVSPFHPVCVYHLAACVPSFSSYCVRLFKL